MKFKTVLLCSVFMIVLPVLAHEFWLQPQQFLFSRGEEINIRLQVGEGFMGENWKGTREKVNNLQLHYSDVSDELKEYFGGEAGDSIQFTLFEEGTAMVTFNNANSFLDLEAKKFTDYLMEDGLTNALEYRREHNETDSAGKEFYQRSVKTIVQVGSVKTEVYKKQTSLPLDLIPQSNPYLVSGRQQLKMKILFNKELLTNHKIRVWHKMPDGVTDSLYMSNENGEISFAVEPAGEWMVSCVQMIRLENNSKAQWQSYWGSCTWGYTGKVVKSDVSR